MISLRNVKVEEVRSQNGGGVRAQEAAYFFQHCRRLRRQSGQPARSRLQSPGRLIRDTHDKSTSVRHRPVRQEPKIDPARDITPAERRAIAQKEPELVAASARWRRNSATLPASPKAMPCWRIATAGPFSRARRRRRRFRIIFWARRTSPGKASSWNIRSTASTA